MPRTIIATRASRQGPEWLYLEEGPPGAAMAGDLVELKLRATDAAFTGLSVRPLKGSAVRDAGKLMYETLLSSEAIKATMPVVLSAMTTDPQPIFFFLNSPVAENLPWEALWETTKEFLALDPHRRWPIARLAFSAARSSTLDRTREPVLKVAAILAAAGEDAGPQWDSLYTALSPLGDKVRIQVFASQDELLQRIRSETGGAGQPSVSVASTGDLKSLLLNMYAFGPNIVHFFCHGSVGDRAALQIETRVDRTTDRAAGSLVVEVADLVTMPGLDTVWLTTLNCCKGARASDKVNSFARTLVESGMPAVVAMREEVAASEAHVFARAFYESLLAELDSAVFQQGSAAPIPVPATVWARALHGPRQELLDRKAAGLARGDAAAGCREWTLPVLYANRAELRLQPRGLTRALGDAAIAKLRVEVSVLRNDRNIRAYNGAPRSILDSLDREIAKCEAQLYASE